MARNRAKVQQLGLFDVEVSAPEHDRIQLWAYERADAILRVAHPEIFGGTWRPSEICPWLPIEGDREVASQRAEAFARENQRPEPRVVKKSLECVLCRRTGHGNKFEQIVGYADLVFWTELPIITVSDQGGVVELSWRGGPRVLVEAKAKLPTVGELMRQLQLYRTAFSGKIVVVSPDTAYAELLAEQDIVFVPYLP